jgi:hypothetical protein
MGEGDAEMEKTATKAQTQSQLNDFIKEIGERFKYAGKPKPGFLRTLLKKIFG